MRARILLSLIVLAIGLAATRQTFAQGTAFIYHGQITQRGQQPNGERDLRFGLFDAPTNGTQIAILDRPGVPVRGGEFTVTLDFGTAFDGNPRWLEISVKNRSGQFVTLKPRQKFMPTPYAIMAGSASNLLGTLPASQLSGTLPPSLFSGTFSSPITLDNPANKFSGSGAGLSGVNAVTLNGLGAADFWRLTGNANTAPGLNFLGTTDNTALELKVNGQRVFRLEPTGFGPNLIGGSSLNFVAPGVTGAVIGGGGSTNLSLFNAIHSDSGVIDGGYANTISPLAGAASIGGGSGNSVQSGYGVVAGGYSSRILPNSPNAVIGGGSRNAIAASSSYSVIAGGSENTNASRYAVIGGGSHNQVLSNSYGAAIVAGAGNIINNADFAFIGAGSGAQALALGAVIGGGMNNTVQTNSTTATIAGGQYHTIEKNSPGATISGGELNRIGTNVAHATIAGGRENSVDNKANYAAIGGGVNNSVTGNYGVIGGGTGNSIKATTSTIGGGNGNTIESGYGVIAGGHGHRITAGSLNAFIGSGNQNVILPEAGHSALVGGQYNTNGSSSAFLGAGSHNEILSYSSYSALAAGAQNTISNASFSFIGSGNGNNLYANYGVIGGGSGNTIEPAATIATIAGGSGGTIGFNANYAFIGGGSGNKVGRNSRHSAIAGGYGGFVGTNATFAAIGGGALNAVLGTNSTVSGGYSNRAVGVFAAIPGGLENSAGSYSLAAGRRAKADLNGSFVWADSNDLDFSSSAANSFSVRSIGGVRFVTAIDGAGTPTAGVELPAGGGSWAALSDRNAKENLTAVNPRDVLDRVAQMPISTWNYKSQDTAIRHIGPMAQDFAAAFQVGEDQRRITTVDADGVALAAIQGLNQIVNEKDTEIKKQAAEIQELKQRLEKLEALMQPKTGGQQ